MSEPRDPGTDVDSAQIIKLSERVSSLTTQVHSLSAGMEKMQGAFERLEAKLDVKTAPKGFNWLGVAALTCTVIVTLSGFLLWSLSPLRRDTEELGRRLTSEVQSLERRQDDKIDAIRRDMQSFKEATNRDLQWNYANQNLRHDHSGKLLEKVWSKVFANDMPAYQPPSKP